MNSLFEQNVTHNVGLAAFAITQAAIRFQEEVNGTRGLDLFAALLIPPLVFHKRTATTLANKQMTEGLFLRVVAEDREIVLGAQARLVDLLPRTLEAIHLACSARLLKMVNDKSIELFPTLKSLPSAVETTHTQEGVRVILGAAKRLGYCFASTELSVVCTLLRVRF